MFLLYFDCFHPAKFVPTPKLPTTVSKLPQNCSLASIQVKCFALFCTFLYLPSHRHFRRFEVIFANYPMLLQFGRSVPTKCSTVLQLRLKSPCHHRLVKTQKWPELALGVVWPNLCLFFARKPWLLTPNFDQLGHFFRHKHLHWSNRSSTNTESLSRTTFAAHKLYSSPRLSDS